MPTNKRRSSQSQERDKQYRQQLRQLKKTGLYEPISDEPTPFRRHRVEELIHQHRKTLNSDKFLFVTAPPIAQKIAQRMGMRTTNTGIFVERDNYETARLVRPKRKRGVYGKTPEYTIIEERRIKTGPRAGKIQDRIIPLVPIEELTKDEQRIREQGEKFGPLQKNQHLGYIIRTKVAGKDIEGYSYDMYDDIGDLIEDFRKKYDPRIDFTKLIRSMHVERSTVLQWKQRAAPHRPTKPHRRRY
jgi:hypothetical protein